MLKKYLLVLAFGCILTLPGAILPGNMHPAGNSIDVPLPAGNWHCRVYDFDGKLLQETNDAQEMLALGVLPVGYYRIELANDEHKELLSAGVVPPPGITPVPPTTPLAVDSALFYVFFTAERGRLAIDYTMDDVISMLRLASVGYARERLWWREFETFSGDDLISRLNRAYRAAGIPVMTSLYGVPQALAWPKTLSEQAERKPPYALRDYYDYLRKLHATNDYAAIESWNEPEGIGGGLLGFEIAAYQRAAALASGSSGITLMGMGTPHDAENLTKNEFNAVQNAYCVHVHDANAKRGTGKIKRYQDVAGELPLWLTEASTGSFDGDPARPGELTPESARKQALDIPKLYARFLHAGAEKIFYFFLFDHAEERNRHYGLLRRRDLMARPGFNTLAVLGQVLAQYRSIRQLELPDAEGFQIVTRFRGIPAEVTLVWSDNASSPFPVPPETTEIFDALGRPVTPQNGHLTLSDNPLYLVTPMKMELTAPPSIARPFAETLPPVVGMVRLPDRQKTVSGDFIQLPAMTQTTLPFALSNFHAEFLAGTITVSDSGETLLTLPVELPADGDAELPLVFTLTNDGAGELKIHSDFGKHGAFDQVIRYRAVRTGLRADDRQTAIPNGEDPRRWHANIIKGSTVEFSGGEGWTVFDYDFKQVANTVVGHVWGSPSLNLNVADFPEFRPDALALEIKLLDGAPVQSLGVNLVEEDGATYIGMINLAEAELRHGAELLLPLDAMVNPPFRKRDANGVLDVEKLISLEIPVWAAPNVKMQLAIRNLRWINYNSQGGKKMNLKRTMQTVAAGTLLAGTLQGAVVAEKQAALKNADFAKTKTNGQPEAWNIGNGSNLILKSETTDDGNQFVTLLAETPVKWASIYQASIAVKDFPPLGENQMYEIVLSFRAKTTNVSDYAFGGIDLRSEKAERLVRKDGPNLKGSSEWQDRTVVLKLDKIPADARFVLASFYLNGTGSFSVDDAKLTIRIVEKK